MANNLPFDKKVIAISMLAEGSSIRSVERVIGVHRDTIMRLGVRVGDNCRILHDKLMRELNCRQIQVDEIWGFIGKKRKNLKFGDEYLRRGDVWTFVAIDPESKVVPSYHVGVRSLQDAEIFLDDLASRLNNRIQLSSDQLRAYLDTVNGAFGKHVDYGQVVKTYAVSAAGKEAASRYSPAEIVKVERLVISGSPEMKLISTSHVERQNLTMRMHSRRLTRLTNAFSKKRRNFEAAMALHFAYYNFCKRHITIGQTPAQAAAVEFKQWSVADLLKHCGE